MTFYQSYMPLYPGSQHAKAASDNSQWEKAIWNVTCPDAACRNCLAKSKELAKGLVFSFVFVCKSWSLLFGGASLNIWLNYIPINITKYIDITLTLFFVTLNQPFEPSNPSQTNDFGSHRVSSLAACFRRSTYMVTRNFPTLFLDRLTCSWAFLWLGPVLDVLSSGFGDSYREMKHSPTKKTVDLQKGSTFQNKAIYILGCSPPGNSGKVQVEISD